VAQCLAAIPRNESVARIAQGCDVVKAYRIGSPVSEKQGELTLEVSSLWEY